ncbi:hypothetical protein VNI00_017446 [Paramarasmius palmivorus]|uniref:Uncharacterized protein n=1 Tax=Paramarasmius palmivorus TaxID=297713 RepID=A0AAW0B5E6_9AGAR
MHPVKTLVPVLLASLAGAATVKLGNTTIIGEDITTRGLEFFGGIPFADPPVGKLSPSCYIAQCSRMEEQPDKNTDYF